jgi:hypothetical protein
VEQSKFPLRREVAQSPSRVSRIGVWHKGMWVSYLGEEIRSAVLGEEVKIPICRTERAKVRAYASD